MDQNHEIGGKLTVVLFTYNLHTRGVWRLRNLFSTIRNAERSSELVGRIIVCDTFNSPFPDNDIDAICAEFRGTHIWHKLGTNEQWSKCQGLNMGLSLVTTEYVMFTDADCAFSRGFFVEAESLKGADKLLICRMYDAVPQIAELLRRGVTWQNFDTLMKSCKPHSLHGVGACQLATTAWFNKIGGYDGNMHLWGGPDSDIVARAKADKLQVVWMPKSRILHQWHPRNKYSKPEFVEAIKKNRVIMGSKDVIRQRMTYPIDGAHDYFVP